MIEEIKEITNKMIKTSQPNGVFLTAETRDKIIYYINNSLEEIERLNNIIDKAIEYIKKHGDYNKSSGCIEELDLYKINELLEILDKGD